MTVGNLCDNVNHTSFTKNCLLKYITIPFGISPMYHKHQNMWQVPELAKMLAQFEYNVDVIDYDEDAVSFTKQYDALIDIYPQQHSYDTALKKDCIKVFFATGAEPMWQKHQIAERLEGLFKRRAVRLPSTAPAALLDNYISSFDALMLFGNELTLNTFSSIPIKRKYMIKNAAVAFDNNPGYAQKSPQVFLYLATQPQLLKGLDLLLEVFAQNPNLYLFVCGQFRQDKEFCQVYEQELFHTKNIIPVGVVDVTSSAFKRIAAIASFAVLPSCSEGMSGSILTAMSAGLIPIVSSACGINEEDAFQFKECSVSNIEQTLKYFAAKDVRWIKEVSLKAVDVINAKYRPQHFTESLYAALIDIL